jgi:hypothetical protein
MPLLAGRRLVRRNQNARRTGQIPGRALVGHGHANRVAKLNAAICHQHPLAAFKDTRGQTVREQPIPPLLQLANGQRGAEIARLAAWTALFDTNLLLPQIKAESGLGSLAASFIAVGLTG